MSSKQDNPDVSLAWRRYTDRQRKRMSGEQDDSDLAEEQIQRLHRISLANDGGEQPEWLPSAYLGAMRRLNHVILIEMLKDVRDLREVVRDYPDMQIAVETLASVREAAINFRVGELILDTPSGNPALTEEEARNATVSEEERKAFFAQAEAEIDAEDNDDE